MYEGLGIILLGHYPRAYRVLCTLVAHTSASILRHQMNEPKIRILRSPEFRPSQKILCSRPQSKSQKFPPGEDVPFRQLALRDLFARFPLINETRPTVIKTVWVQNSRFLPRTTQVRRADAATAFTTANRCIGRSCTFTHDASDEQADDAVAVSYAPCTASPHTLVSRTVPRKEKRDSDLLPSVAALIVGSRVTALAAVIYQRSPREQCNLLLKRGLLGRRDLSR